MTELTAKQREILRVITLFQVEHDGYSPSTGELKALYGVKSDNGIMKHLKALRMKGELRVLDGFRHIAITDAAKKMLIEKWTNELYPHTSHETAPRTPPVTHDSAPSSPGAHL